MSDWQISLTEQGSIVQELADINQCIILIITTQKGSDPMKPRFGVDLLKWIDKPVNVVVPGLITEITNQIQQWEPRVKVLQVTYQMNEAAIDFKVHWQLKSTGVTNTTSYTYDG